MIIHVTKEDIEKGRFEAHENCGCPIWNAVVRELGIPENVADDLVEVESCERLIIGGTTFNLPPEAVSFQRVLIEFPQATVEEITFVAEVGTYENLRKKPEVKEQQASPATQQIEKEKPSLLERVFGR